MSNSPRSLKRTISPPPLRRPSKVSRHQSNNSTASPAAIEAGQVDIQNHLDYFCTEFEKVRRPTADQAAGLSIAGFRALYTRNQQKTGCHFVIHQHDHPIAGVHYDLRLQFSGSSSLSFSIPYGLPGNPNSMRPNRMAIETRVHNLWNNLLESASHSTGSLLIWDTGEYEVRPRNVRRDPGTDDEASPGGETEVTSEESTRLSEPEKLALAFQKRHIHLRLHGTRLPQGYTIAMRLPRQNNLHKKPVTPKRRRRHHESTAAIDPSTSESDNADSGRPSTPERMTESTVLKAAAVASDDESKDTDQQEEIRRNNAYPGAINSIGSIHQRQWFLSLDRVASGFVKATKDPGHGLWTRKTGPDGKLSGFESFTVMGRDVERSVVTGRTAMEAMEDAGVVNYKGRKMWRPVIE